MFRRRPTICIIKSLPWWQGQLFGCSSGTLKCCVYEPPSIIPDQHLAGLDLLHHTRKPDLSLIVAPQSLASAAAHQPFLPSLAVQSLPFPAMQTVMDSLSRLDRLSTFHLPHFASVTTSKEAFNRDTLFSGTPGGRSTTFENVSNKTSKNTPLSGLPGFGTLLPLLTPGHTAHKDVGGRDTFVNTSHSDVSPQTQLHAGWCQSLLDRKRPSTMDPKMTATAMQRRPGMIE
jgi:hypothetical protein